MNRQKIGVLVAQLGTPQAPTAEALRPYLKQFLSDRRVIDYHPLVWQPILHGIILRFRPAKSAKLYQRIWMKEGSPLLVYSQRQAAGLQERLGDQFRVILGMTYGEPSISCAIRQLESENIENILVFSMFPQYSSTTTAAIYDAVYEAAAGKPHHRKRYVPTLRLVSPYPEHPAYIHALKTRIQESLSEWGHTPDKFLITFHGEPNRYIRTGDPYREQCEGTARALAKALDLNADQWTISFQSQFGPEKWLEPYTEDVITAMPGKGVKTLAAVCPGFTADCLETLDEIGNEGREQFKHGGGDPNHFHLIPCLNDHPAWLDAMTETVQMEAQGWI